MESKKRFLPEVNDEVPGVRAACGGRDLVVRWR